MTAFEKPPENTPIKAFLEKGVESGIFPGAVLLTAFKGKLIFFEKAGRHTTAGDSPPMAEDTLFDLASLTKPLATTLAIMKLVDSGEIQLDKSLEKLLPGFLPDPVGTLTPRLLLCHSAGLKSWAPFYRELSALPETEAKEGLRKRILDTPMAYAPGKGVLYSDLGFVLLEWVIEEVAGTTMPRFLEDHFYGPLNMKKTGFFKNHPTPGASADKFAPTEFCPWRKRVIQGEVHDENAYAVGGYSGQAGLFSRAGDLFALTEMLLGHYYEERDDFLKPETVRAFFSRQDLVTGSTWALGWDTPSPRNSSAGDCFSRESVGHLGFTGTSVWIDLDRGIPVILLTNRVHPTRINRKIREFRPALHNLIMNYFS